MIGLGWPKKSLDSSSGVMNPNPLSSLNHLTVPVAIVFLRRWCVLRTRRCCEQGYERWHYDVGQHVQPDASTVACTSRPQAARKVVPLTIGRSSAVDMQRWKPVGADPFLYARQVCDAAMYSVDHERGIVKHAYPHDHVSPPPVARHIVDETDRRV